MTLGLPNIDAAESIDLRLPRQPLSRPATRPPDLTLLVAASLPDERPELLVVGELVYPARESLRRDRREDDEVRSKLAGERLKPLLDLVIEPVPSI
jgi:hypothetical protein